MSCPSILEQLLVILGQKAFPNQVCGFKNQDNEVRSVVLASVSPSVRVGGREGGGGGSSYVLGPAPRCLG